MTRSGDEMMSDMRSVTLRMPDDVADWVEQLARHERRSLNSQLVWILERFRETTEHEGKASPPERDS
jgi:hypothetical protein